VTGFGKEGPFDRAHGHELVEWLGEISGRICILNYGLLSNLEDFKNQYDCDLFAEKKKMLDKLMEEGFISIQNGRLFPAQTGLVVADSLSLI
jgi:hypothetical protein